MINKSFLHLVDSLHTVAEVSLPLARVLGPETTTTKKETSFSYNLSELQLNWLVCIRIRFFKTGITVKVLGHFTLLPTYGASVNLPFPTPNTMLMLSHIKLTGHLFQHYFGSRGSEN